MLVDILVQRFSMSLSKSLHNKVIHSSISDLDTFYEKLL